MKTFCVISNSHLAAMKLGWRRLRDEYPQTDMTFFGATAGYVEQLRVDGRSLLPTSADAAQKFEKFSGQSRISGEHDGFVICDLGIRVGLAVRLYRDYRAESHLAEGNVPVSDECFRLALLGLIRETIAVKTVQKLRRITNAPIALLQAPMSSPQHPDPWLKTAHANGDGATLANAFADATCELASELDLRLFFQPSATLIGPLYTNPLYTRANNRGRGQEVVQGDHGHMNGRYGELVLRDVLAGML